MLLGQVQIERKQKQDQSGPQVVGSNTTAWRLVLFGTEQDGRNAVDVYISVSRKLETEIKSG